ncbi:MAG: DNA primase [Rickettsiales bacterium]|nr:DNA primase [Rickettsiales bacterium]
MEEDSKKDKPEIKDFEVENALNNDNENYPIQHEEPPTQLGKIQMPPLSTQQDNMQVQNASQDQKPKSLIRKTNYEQLVEDIKARGISSVIERFCRLQNAGAGRKKARCPFHHEKTPSFHVDERKGFYKCFGCGESGDVFKFVEKIRSCDFLQSVDYLCDFFGIDKSKYVTQDEGSVKQQASFYKTMSVIADFYEQELKQNQDASLYVSGVRGLTDETVKKYKIGLANNDLDALQTYCEAHGIGEAELLDSGVVRKSEKDDEKYLFFRDRIMIPITNPSGKIVAFGGRIYRAADEANKVAKYLNSSENFYFKKGRILFNLHNAKQALTADKQFIIVEGYMDVIALAQAGINTGIAPLGTSITDEHLKLIVSYCKRPIFVFDNDNAGHKASLRACEMMFPILRSGIVPKFCMLEGAKDCDEYLKKYATEDLQKQFDGAILIDEFLFVEKCKQYGIEQGKQANPNVLAQMQSDVMSLIRRIPDEILKENYVNIFKDKFWKLQHARSATRIGYTNYKRPSIHSGNNVDTLEKNIIAHLLNKRELLEDFDINENVICRLGEKNRELLNTLLGGKNRTPLGTLLENKKENQVIRYQRKYCADENIDGLVAKHGMLLNNILSEDMEENNTENQAMFCRRYWTSESIEGLVAKLKMAALNSSKLPEKVKANEKRKLIEERKKALKAFVEEEE